MFVIALQGHFKDVATKKKKKKSTVEVMLQYDWLLLWLQFEKKEKKCTVEGTIKLRPQKALWKVHVVT